MAVLLTGFSDGPVVKNLPANAGDTRLGRSSLGWEDPLEKEMATHSSILAWEIPWTEEPGGLQSMASQSPNLATDMHARTHFIDYLKPLSCFPVPK